MNQNPFKSAVKPDPYSNKTHQRIDVILVVITLVLMIVAFRASPQHRATSGEQTRAEQIPVRLGHRDK
jgi:hypothetical protein